MIFFLVKKRRLFGFGVFKCPKKRKRGMNASRLGRYDGLFVVKVGDKIDWKDGVETGPPPECEELRQVVCDKAFWNKSCWCSREGAIYTRYYNPFSDVWQWNGPKFPNENNQVFMYDQWIKIERAVAISHLDFPAKDGSVLHAKQVCHGRLTPDTVGWVKPGTKSISLHTSIPNDLPVPRDDDEWTVLVYTWFNSAGDPVEHFRPEVYGKYMISKRGWLKSPHSKQVTRGAMHPNGRRWASIAGASFVWMDEALLRSFTSSPLSNSQVGCEDQILTESLLDSLYWITPPPQPQETTIISQLVNESRNASDICSALSCSNSSLWNKMISSSRNAASTNLEWILKITPKEVRDSVLENAEKMLSLQGLFECVDETMKEKSFWKSLPLRDKYGVVSLSWEFLLRKQFLLRNSSN